MKPRLTPFPGWSSSIGGRGRFVPKKVGKGREEFGPRKAVSMRGVRALRSVADSSKGNQPMLVPDYSDVIYRWQIV